MLARLLKFVNRLLSAPLVLDIRIGQPIQDEWTGRERALRTQWVTVHATQLDNNRNV